jgi:hypothetical protein
LKIQIKIEDNDNLKEAHDLLLKLGFSTYNEESFGVWDNCPKPIWLKTNCFDGEPNKIDWVDSGDYKPSKEITLPQLRDLVVLKRNSIDDATHTDGHCSFYVGKDKNYFFSSCYKAWCGTWKNVDILKPIEKPTKEYLRKNSNGTYSYIGTVRPEHVSYFMIEIPEGGNIAVIEDSKVKFYSKYRSADLDHLGKDLIWIRPSHPEELPFIDDEPLQSLNDQYAEIEKVHQSHRTASEIADSALKHIRERAETYDQPTGERSAAKTAKAFNAITGKDITESEVWLLLQLLKDILAAAEYCLEGKLRTKKDFLGRYRLDFDLSTFKGYSKPARKSMGRQTYRPYSLREAVTPSNKDVPDDNKKDV